MLRIISGLMTCVVLQTQGCILESNITIMTIKNNNKSWKYVSGKRKFKVSQVGSVSVV